MKELNEESGLRVGDYIVMASGSKIEIHKVVEIEQENPTSIAMRVDIVYSTASIPTRRTILPNVFTVYPKWKKGDKIATAQEAEDLMNEWDKR